jgi:hypothetical protein
MFGEFAVDPADGRQVGHRTVSVRWTDGRLVSIWG